MSDATPREADPREILKASQRFDLVFKLAMAKAILGGDAAEIRTASEAYLESVRARNGLYEEEPRRRGAADFLASIRRTVESIRAKGYDPHAPAIPVDAHGELLNGAHRLTACVACGCPCRIVASDAYPAGGSVMRTFVKGHIHPAVLNWGVRKYCELIPDGRLCAAFGPLENYPALPFPDWTRRRTWPYRVKPLLTMLWCRLCLPFKRGEKAAKVRRRLLRARNQFGGYAALASYWKEHAQ